VRLFANRNLGRLRPTPSWRWPGACRPRLRRWPGMAASSRPPTTSPFSASAQPTCPSWPASTARWRDGGRSNPDGQLHWDTTRENGPEWPPIVRRTVSC